MSEDGGETPRKPEIIPYSSTHTKTHTLTKTNEQIYRTTGSQYTVL